VAELQLLDSASVCLCRGLRVSCIKAMVVHFKRLRSMHITRKRVTGTELASLSMNIFLEWARGMPAAARATGRIHDSPREVQISESCTALRTMRLRPGTHVATPPRSHTSVCDHQRHASGHQREPAEYDWTGPLRGSGQHGRVHGRQWRRPELTAGLPARGLVSGGLPDLESSSRGPALVLTQPLHPSVQPPW